MLPTIPSKSNGAFKQVQLLHLVRFGDAKLRESYRRVLRHLHENTLSASDLSRIQNALTFLSPLCRDTREAHKDMMGVTLKTDALLRSSR